MTASSKLVASVLVLQHYKESRRKCTLRALRSRSELDASVDMEFRTVRPFDHPERALTVDGGIVLTVGAPVLSPEDGDGLGSLRRLILLDGTWAKIPYLLQNLRLSDASGGASESLLYRAIPDGVQTAYPRHSKIYSDPDGGLASVEALAIALAILGSPGAAHVLTGYRWGDEFLRRNAERFEELGLRL